MKSVVKYILSVLLIAVPLTLAQAQKVEYLDAKRNPANAKAYTYKRVVKYKGPVLTTDTHTDYYGNVHSNVRQTGLHSFSITDYYATGEVAFVVGAISSDINASTYNYDGKGVWYHKNGRMSIEGFFGIHGLQGQVRYYSEAGTLTRHELYQGGKFIQPNRFGASPRHPLIGTWHQVKYSQFSLPGMPPIVENEYYAILTPDSILEIRYPQNSISALLAQGSEYYNWRYTEEDKTTGLFEQFVGDELLIRIRMRWISNNQMECTTLLHPDSGRINQTFTLTRQ